MKIIPLVLVAALAAAEPDPQPAAPAPAEAAAQPAATATAEAAAAAPRPGRGVRVATAGERPPIWDARAVLTSGYDSNAVLASDPDETTAGTGLYTGELGIGWRPVMDRDRYLRLGLAAAYDRRPGVEDLDTGRIGVLAVGARQADGVVQGASLDATRYLLDDEGAAAEARGGLSLAWVRPDQVDLASLELSAVHYDAAGDRPGAGAAWTTLGDADDRSGVLAAAGWRRWWNRPDRSRYEAALRLGRNHANSEAETYTSLQPQAGVRLRPDDGAWDVQARLVVELRDYDATRDGEEGSERMASGSLTVSGDRRLGGGLWLGAVAGLSARASTAIDRDYERWQAALRLTYLISAEDL